jgi:uncharacterized membrane protein YdjX (TVP38/TMEM64 family)
MNLHVGRWLGAAIILVVLVCVAAAGTLLDKEKAKVCSFLIAVGGQGAVTYIVFSILAYPIFAPVILLQIFAGALFPFWLAVVINWVGSVVGGLLGFALSRYLFRETVLAWLIGHPELGQLSASMGKRGLRTALLLRLSPIVPDTWLNYVLGSGPIALWDFLLSTAAVEPLYNSVYAYYGRAFGAVALGREGLDEFASSSEGRALLLVGLPATLFLTVVLGRHAKAALDQTASVPASGPVAAASTPLLDA